MSGIPTKKLHMETTLCFATASALEAVDVDLINTHQRTNLSPAMALALESVGWSTAEHWLRMQASYDLAALHRRGQAASCRSLNCGALRRVRF